MEDKILRRLVIKPFSINEVLLGEKFSIKGDKLEISKNKLESLKKENELITEIKLEVKTW